MRPVAIALALLVVAAPLAQAQAIRGGTRADTPRRPVTRAIALTNARVVQAPGHVIERATVVVRDGVIVEVGPGVTVPPDAEAIAADSFWVYAGFIDALGFAGVPADSVNKGEKVENPGDPPRERAGLQPDRDVRSLFAPAEDVLAQWRDLGFAAAHVAPRRGVLAGQGRVALMRPPARAEDAGALFLTEPVSLFSTFEPAEGVYPATAMGVAAVLRASFEEARRRGGARAAYDHDPDGIVRPALDVQLDALQEMLDEERSLVVRADNALDAFRALRLADELDLPLVLAGLPEATALLDRLSGGETPVLAPLALPDTLAADTSLALPPLPTDPGGTQFISERRILTYEDVDDDRAALTQQRRAAIRRFEANPARLAAAEIPFAFATLDAKPGAARANLRRMVAAGLSEDDALAALTTTPAQLFGLERVLGTVEEGRLANLVVTDGDFFGDSTRVRMVFVEGTKFEVELEEDEAKEDKPADSTAVARADSTARADSAATAGPPSLRRFPGLRTASALPPADARGSLLIRNATVHTVTRGTLEEADVLVRDGRIAEVGRGLEAPRGVEVVDAAGLHVMPGIVDPHSHIALSNVNEATNPVVAEVQMRDALDPFDIDLYRALAGGVTTIQTLHGSANVIGGEAETIKLRYGTADPEGLVMEGAPRTIKFALGENPTRLHGRSRGIRPNTRMGVEWVVREAFEDARRYRAESEAARREGRPGPPLDRRLETLADVLAGDVLVHAHSYRADEILMLLGVLRDYGVDRATFQHANEAFKVAPELAAAGAGASVFSDWWSYKFEVYYSTAYNAAILARNGVRTSVNSDDAGMMRHLYHEAAKAQRYGGLSDDEALALVTINPAWQLGIDERVGSIEVGKDADLALFTAHPLSIYAAVVQTVVDGVVRFDRARDGDDMRLTVDPAADVEEVRLDAGRDEDACLEGALMF